MCNKQKFPLTSLWLTFILLSQLLTAQEQEPDKVAPASPAAFNLPGQVDWSHAGYSGKIPDLQENIIDLKKAGVKGDGKTDDYNTIQTVISRATAPAVIYFPAGTYLINGSLTLKSGIVLRGAGTEVSRLLFNSPGGCIKLAGAPAGQFTAIINGLQQGSTRITVAEASAFKPGQGGEIRQEDIIKPAAGWGAYAVGQMIKITAIEKNILTIAPPLHIAYTTAKKPEIRPIRYIEQVGVENLYIRRLDSGSKGGESNFNIRRAADCWVRGIESDFTEKYHFAISESLHLEIRDSCIHHAKSKGDGGLGYGVSLARCATSLLIENNIFYELRHAMILQIGVNGCVFGYNFAAKNYSDDGWDKAYISLHGHYPYMNLFEGNIVGWAFIGDYWGPVGPGNTFFRNKILGTDKHTDFGPYRGITLGDYHGIQNIIGNELVGGTIYSSKEAALPGVLIHGNRVKGEILWEDSFTDKKLPPSLYLAGKPGFYKNLNWPSLGSDQPPGGGTIPAWERWQIIQKNSAE